MKIYTAKHSEQTPNEDIVGLDAAQAAALRQQLITLEPATLQDIDLAARDGISLRCDCQERGIHHAFTMRSPTAKEAPRHAAVCRLFLEATHAHVHHPQLQDYLTVLARSFQ